MLSKLLLLFPLVVASLSAQVSINSPAPNSTINLPATFVWNDLGGPASSGGWPSKYYVNFSHGSCSDNGVGGGGWQNGNSTGYSEPGYSGFLYVRVWFLSNGAGQVACAQYNVSAVPAPTITSASPSNLILNQITAVDVYGNNFTPVFSVWLGVPGVGSWQQTQLTYYDSHHVRVNLGPTGNPPGYAMTLTVVCTGGSATTNLQAVPAGPVASGGFTTYAVQPDWGIDPYTGYAMQEETSLHPISLSVGKGVRLSDGRPVPVNRADKLKVEKLSWSHAPADNGRIRYDFVIDNRELYLFRIGNISDDDQILNGDVQSEAPMGWNNFLIYFGVAEKPSRAVDAKYSITSKWKPGLLPVYFQNETSSVPVDNFPGTEDNLKVVAANNIFVNSQRAWVIGPAIDPEWSKVRLTEMVTQWAEDYRFTFLRPLLNGAALADLTPETDLEKEIVDCLRGVWQ